MSSQNYSSCGCSLQSVDGLLRWILLQLWRKDNKRYPVQVEKNIKKILETIISKVLKSTNRWCFLIPLLLSIFSVMQHNNLRDYLICTSREEQLRFNLENFWMSEEYPESLTTLPFYHPYEVLIQIVCKYCLTKHKK